MSEQAIFTSRAVVYVVDPVSRGWVASGVAGFTRLDIYVHSGTGAARVIGRGIDDPSKVVINSNITKDITYTKARDTFHQWSDARGAFGLNFSTAPEADGFAAAFENAKQGGGAKPAPPAAPAPKPAPPPVVAKPAPPAPSPAAPPSAPAAPAAPPSAPAAGGPPAPPPGPPAPPKPAAGKPGAPPPPPPKAPPKPPASSGGGGGDAPPANNALLNSITGFSKGGLKKTVTVDKSSPIVGNKPAAPSGGNSLTRKEAGSLGASGGQAAPPASSGGGGGVGDMMAEMMKKRNAMASKAASGEPAAPKPAPVAKPPAPTATLKTSHSVGAKPAPPPSAAKSSLTPTPSFSSTATPSPRASVDGELPEHLQLLKEQILAEVRVELAQLKADILEALNNK